MNQTVKKVINVTAATALTAGASVLGFGGYLFAKNKKKLDNSNGQNNLMHTIVFGKASIDTASDTDNVFLATAFTDVTIDMTKEPIVHDVTVDLQTYFSGIYVKVPEGVRVICDISPKRNGIVNVAENCENEDAPTICVTGKAECCGISVGRG